MKSAIAVSSAACLLAATPAHALDYWLGKPMVFTFQNKCGYWFGCGPTQCLWTGYDAEEEAFGLINGYKLDPWHFIGSYGRCRVYQGMGDLDHGDHTTEWVVDKIMDKC